MHFLVTFFVITFGLSTLPTAETKTPAAADDSPNIHACLLDGLSFTNGLSIVGLFNPNVFRYTCSCLNWGTGPFTTVVKLQMIDVGSSAEVIFGGEKMKFCATNISNSPLTESSVLTFVTGINTIKIGVRDAQKTCYHEYTITCTKPPPGDTDLRYNSPESGDSSADSYHRDLSLKTHTDDHMRTENMNVAQMFKFTTMGFMMCVGIWFATAQPHFAKESEARPLLFVTVGLSFIITLGTIIHTFSSTVPYGRMTITLVLASFAALLIKLSFRAIKAKNLGLAFSGVVPKTVVQFGPYRFVRHPLYLAYSIFWTSCAIFSASLFVTIAVVGLIALYFHAASSEERDLLNSNVGSDYKAYRARTGIMLPRLL